MERTSQSSSFYIEFKDTLDMKVTRFEWKFAVEADVLRSGRRFTQRLKTTRLCWMPPPIGLQLSRMASRIARL